MDIDTFDIIVRHKRKTGGLAFPRNGHPDRDDWPEYGMTLLDYFAGQALAGYMTLAAYPQAPNDNDMAHYCYNVAAEMLKEKRRIEE